MDYGVVKCSFPKPPRAPLFLQQKVSRQVLSPTTGFPSSPHSTRSPQMCFVSHAIAPRLPWLESHLGHWYWDVPSYAHRYVEHRKSFDKSGEEFLAASPTAADGHSCQRCAHGVSMRSACNERFLVRPFGSWQGYCAR